MAEIFIERSHELGLQKARQLAAQWAERMEKAHGVQCTCIRGRGEDVTHFSRTGMNGTATVSGKRFALDMKLGFLFGLFSQRISEAVTRELDELLGSAAQGKGEVAPPAAPVKARARTAPNAVAKPAAKVAGKPPAKPARTKAAAADAGKKPRAASASAKGRK